MDKERLEYLRKKKRLAELRAKKGEQAAPMPPEDDGSTLTDFGRGVGQGATLGFIDEATGAIGAAIDPNDLRQRASEAGAAMAATREEAEKQDPAAIAEAMQAEGFSPEEIREQLAFVKKAKTADTKNIYEIYRDKARAKDLAARKRSPLAMGLGEMAGALGTGGVAGIRSLPALAAEGSLYGLGSSEGEIGDQLKNAATGGLTSLAFGAGGKLIGAAGNKIKGFLAKKASEKAIAATRPTPSQAEKMINPERIGNMLIDEKIIGAGKSATGMKKSAEGALSKYGDDLDDMYASYGGAPAKTKDIVLSLWKQSNKIAGEATANKPVANKIKEFARDMNKRGGTLSPKQIRKEKQALDKVINWQSDAPAQEAKKAIYHTLQAAEENLYATVDDVAGKTFKQLKQKVSDLETVDDILKRTASRDVKKSGMQHLTDAVLTGGIAGSTTVLDEHPEAMILMGTLGAARKIGPGGGAQALRGLSKMPSLPIPAGTTGRMVNSLNFYGQKPE